jgi:hypothetical protein
LIEQTAEDQQVRQDCQDLLRQWRQGEIAAADWLKLQDQATVEQHLKPITSTEGIESIRIRLERISNV